MKRIDKLASTIASEWNDGKTDSLINVFKSWSPCSHCIYHGKEEMTYTDKNTGELSTTKCKGIYEMHMNNNYGIKCENGIDKYLNQEENDG